MEVASQRIVPVVDVALKTGQDGTLKVAIDTPLSNSYQCLVDLDSGDAHIDWNRLLFVLLPY